MRPRVLVARMDSNGDVLLAGPAVRAVAATASVAFLCGPRGAQAAELLPGVDRLLIHRAAWIDPEPPALDREVTLRLVARLAALELDQALVLTSYHQSALPLALLLRLAGVPVIAAISDDYPGSLLDVRHRVDDGLHEVERSLSLVETLGYRLPVGDDGRLRVEIPARPPAAEPYVVLHPGASVPARTWSAERYAELAGLLAGTGRRVVVTGSPDERDLTGRVAGVGARVENLGGRTSFAELAAVLKAAACVVTGNSGPAHLAAAVGTPVVSMFAPTVPWERWRPWGVPVVRLGVQDLPCSGCRARRCWVAGHPCLETVRPEDAWAAVEELAPRRLQEPAA